MFIEHDDPIKEEPHYFPLYNTWKRFNRRGVLGPEFESFHAFYAWAIEHNYQRGDRIYRLYKNIPLSPDNGMISKEKTNADTSRTMANIVGGYRNSPCNNCPANTDGWCNSYRECAKYRAWLNKSWEDFRKAAGING